MSATTEDFRQQLQEEFRKAEKSGFSHININAGELHRKVGHYPVPEKGNHQSMPSCCNVMWGAKGKSDDVLSSPPKGRGASLTIRYKLPR